MQILCVKRLQGNQFVGRVLQTNVICRFAIITNDATRLSALKEGVTVKPERAVFDIQTKIVRIEEGPISRERRPKGINNEFGFRQSLDA
jgi:hypothetical protein